MAEIVCDDAKATEAKISSSSLQDESKIAAIHESPLDLLPDELLLMILEHVTLPDLALRIWRPLRNRRLRRLCQDPRLCKSITVDSVWDKDTTRAVLSMARQRLEELTVAVKKKNDYYFNLRAAIASRSTTWHLQRHLLDRVASDAVFSTVLSVLEECGNKITLHKLSLKTKVTSKLANYCPLAITLLAHLPAVRNLTSIDFREAQFARAKGSSGNWIKAVADNCIYLEHAHLPFLTYMTDELLDYFLERVQGRLRHLALACFKITDASYCTLKHCQKLEELMIQGAWKIGQKGLKTVLELPNLEQLYMSGARSLTEADFSQALLGKVMPKMKCLEMDDVAASTDDGTLESLSQSYPNLHVLLLFMRGNQGVREVGIQSILNKCKKLAVFSMLEYVGKPPPSITGFHCQYLFEIIDLKTRFYCTYRSKELAWLKKVTSLRHHELIWNVPGTLA